MTSCKSADQRQDQGMVDSYISVPDTTIATEYGDILLRNMRMEIGERYTGGSMVPTPETLSGQIVNQTDRKWSFLTFNLSMYSPSGFKMGPTEITYFEDLPSGDIAYFEEYLIDLEDRYRPETEYDYEFSLRGGSFPVSYEFSMLSPIESSSLSYSDSTLSIAFIVSKSEIAFRLENKSDQSITIDWNSTSYVDTKGSTRRVIHKGVRYSQRDQPMASTTIPPNANTEDIIHPTNRISYDDYSNDWTRELIFPNGAPASLLVGEDFGIYMPMKIGSKSKDYNFQFTIDSVKPEA